MPRLYHWYRVRAAEGPRCEFAGYCNTPQHAVTCWTESFGAGRAVEVVNEDTGAVTHQTSG